MSANTPYGMVTLSTPAQLTPWLVRNFDAAGKYHGWEMVTEAALCLGLGDGLWVVSDQGLVPLSADVQGILNQTGETVDEGQWQTLIDDLFPRLFAHVDYTVGWEDGRPGILLDLDDGQWCFLDVPVNSRLRGLLWEVLKGNRVAWVAESSNSTNCRSALSQSTLELTKPLEVLISCPTKDYDLPNIMSQWEDSCAALRARIAELGLPITVRDLSGVEAADAAAQVMAALSAGATQVLGFFHRAEADAFEIGAGGRLTRGDIANMAPTVEERKFLAVLGCKPLLYGLNDAFIEKGLSTSTLTVGEELNLGRVFEYLGRLVEEWGEELAKGRMSVPMTDLLPDLDVAPLGEAPSNRFLG
jgi:hypothetical protein